jgi:DNA-binding NtrC family response regulator
MRVLVVDDEQNIRKAFTRALEAMGHEVAAVTSGSVALKQCSSRVSCSGWGSRSTAASISVRVLIGG